MMGFSGWRRWLGVVLTWGLLPFMVLASSDDDTFDMRTKRAHYPSVLASAFMAFPQEQLQAVHVFLKEAPEVETELLRRAEMPLARVARNMGVARGQFGPFIWDPRHDAYLVALAALNPGLFHVYKDSAYATTARALFARQLFLMDKEKASCVLSRPSLYGPHLVDRPQMILEVDARRLGAITPTKSALTEEDVNTFCTRLKGAHERAVFVGRIRKLFIVCTVLCFAYLMTNG